MTTSLHPFYGLDEQFDQASQFCDFFEPHIWMAASDFYARVGWTFKHKWDNSEFELVADHAENIYRSDQEHWLSVLQGQIDRAVAHAQRTKRPLITTECWSIVDYKDAPRLDWGWVKESTAEGVRRAAATGAWAAIATSNFCGPQFVGMWRDIAWHQELTTLIKQSTLPSWPSKLTGHVESEALT